MISVYREAVRDEREHYYFLFTERKPTVRDALRFGQMLTPKFPLVHGFLVPFGQNLRSERILTVRHEGKEWKEHHPRSRKH